MKLVTIYILYTTHDKELQMSTEIEYIKLTDILSADLPDLRADLEGIREIASIFGKKVDWLLNAIANVNGANPEQVSSVVGKAITRLNSVGMGNLNHFEAISPEGMRGEMLPYLKTLSVAMAELSTVKGRALIPLQKWASNILTDNTYATKIWLSTNVDNVDLKKVLKPLQKVYSDGEGDDLTRNKLPAIFPAPKDITACAEALGNLNILSLSVMDDRLEELAAGVSELFILLKEQKDTLFDETDPKVMKIVAQAIFDTGKELEALAVLVFQVRIAGRAFNASMDKIIDQL